jgi:hypothetical protein
MALTRPAGVLAYGRESSRRRRRSPAGEDALSRSEPTSVDCKYAPEARESASQGDEGARADGEVPLSAEMSPLAPRSLDLLGKDPEPLQVTDP